MLRWFVPCALLALLGSGLFSTQAAESVVIEYRAPYWSVLINGERIVTTEQDNEFANPASSTPSRTVKVTKETKVTSAQVKELLDAIDAAKFHDLKDEYGVKPDQRHYPYEVRVKAGTKQKVVIYRSGGDSSQRPEALKKVEKEITDFARRATTINRP